MKHQRTIFYLAFSFLLTVGSVLAWGFVRILTETAMETRCGRVLFHSLIDARRGKSGPGPVGIRPIIRCAV